MHAVAFSLALAFAPLQAQAQDCRLALLLALDVSSSVDKVEYALQTGGLASALLAPEVQRAFLVQPEQPVALAVFEWSGRYNQITLQDWVLIQSPAQLLSVAEAITNHTRSHDDFPTAMGYALGHAATLMQAAPRCTAQTVDISGDGITNEGFGPKQAYQAFAFGGITVNGLAINGADYEAETNLLEYYRTEVLHGAGAFLEIAQGFEDFERAMRRKLERELAPAFLTKAPEPTAPFTKSPAKNVNKYSVFGRPNSAQPVSARW